MCTERESRESQCFRHGAQTSFILPASNVSLALNDSFYTLLFTIIGISFAHCKKKTTGPIVTTCLLRNNRVLKKLQYRTDAYSVKSF